MASEVIVMHAKDPKWLPTTCLTARNLFRDTDLAAAAEYLASYHSYVIGYFEQAPVLVCLASRLAKRHQQHCAQIKTKSAKALNRFKKLARGNWTSDLGEDGPHVHYAKTQTES